MEKLSCIFNEYDIRNKVKGNFRNNYIYYKNNNNDFINIEIDFTGNYSIEDENILDSIHFVQPPNNLILTSEEKRHNEENTIIVYTYKKNDDSSNNEFTKLPGIAAIYDYINKVDYIHDYGYVIDIKNYITEYMNKPFFNKNYNTKIINNDDILYILKYTTSNYTITRRIKLVK